jgi:hypothetical protein
MPCLARARGATGGEVIRVGHPLLDAYVELVAARARWNTVPGHRVRLQGVLLDHRQGSRPCHGRGCAGVHNGAPLQRAPRADSLLSSIRTDQQATDQANGAREVPLPNRRARPEPLGERPQNTCPRSPRRRLSVRGRENRTSRRGGLSVGGTALRGWPRQLPTACTPTSRVRPITGTSMETPSGALATLR